MPKVATLSKLPVLYRRSSDAEAIARFVAGEEGSPTRNGWVNGA